MAENKITYGLKKAHFAPFTVNNGVITYDTPIPLPGSVSLTLNPRGDLAEFYADDMLYYSAANNQGYDGTLSIANMPESFAIEALGEIKDVANGLLTENASSKGRSFALLFEFDGDVKATRHILYNCTANRPTISSATRTGTVEPVANELTFIASPRETDTNVKTKTTSTTSPAVYDNWYTAVFEATTIAVTSVTLLPDTTSISVGGIQQLATTVLPANATNRNVIYTSSAPTKATVSSTGLVTGIAAGSATITVTTADGSLTDTCAVTVA